jgi:hypothetical protein
VFLLVLQLQTFSLQLRERNSRVSLSLSLCREEYHLVVAELSRVSREESCCFAESDLLYVARMASSVSSTTTANQKKKLAHRSLALTSNHWIENEDAPLFKSSFSSIYSVPRRQPPSLNDITFGDSLLDDSIPVFRQPGSTERAMAALSQSKYERMERRRALMLLGVLLILAVATKVSTSQMSNLNAEAVTRFRNPNSSPSSGFDNTMDQAPISEMALSPEAAGPQVAEEDPLFEALQHLAEFSDTVTPNDIPVSFQMLL